MQKWAVLAVATMVVVGFAAPASADDECKANFTETGSFLAGHTFKTHAVVPVSKDVVYKRVYAFPVEESWRILQANEDVGVISASTDIRGSNNGTAPMGIVLSDENGGQTKVSITFNIGIGKIAPHVDDYLCKIANAAANGN